MQMESQLLISACRLVMLYISTKFCEIIMNGIKVIERIRFLYRSDTENYKENNSSNNVGESNCCKSLHVFWSCFIFVPSLVKLSRSVSKL